MRNTYQRVGDFSAKHRCDPRTACYGVALERIIQAYLERGIFP
jgi:glutamate dehydrogenase/leucine dehydrogenase